MHVSLTLVRFCSLFRTSTILSPLLYTNCSKIQTSRFEKCAYFSTWRAYNSEVHILWKGHKILRNLHLTFDWYYTGQKLDISQNRVAFSEYMNLQCLHMSKMFPFQYVWNSLNLNEFWFWKNTWKISFIHFVEPGKKSKLINVGSDTLLKSRVDQLILTNFESKS